MTDDEASFTEMPFVKWNENNNQKSEMRQFK